MVMQVNPLDVKHSFNLTLIRVIQMCVNITYTFTFISITRTSFLQFFLT